MIHFLYLVYIALAVSELLLAVVVLALILGT